MKRWLSAMAAVTMALVGLNVAPAPKAEAVPNCIRIQTLSNKGQIFHNCSSDSTHYRAAIQYRNGATGRLHYAYGPYVGYNFYSNTGDVAPNPITARFAQAAE